MDLRACAAVAAALLASGCELLGLPGGDCWECGEAPMDAAEPDRVAVASRRERAMLPANTRIVAGDVDGDARIDLVSAAEALAIHRTDGGSLLRTAIPLEDGWGSDAYYSPLLGDVDGDGVTDLFVRRWSEPHATGFLRGEGGGAFAGPLPLLEPVEMPGFVGFDRVELGDVDGDGRADLLGSYGTFFFTWARGREAGGFEAPVHGWEAYDAQAYRAHQRPTFATGDVDGDGRTDAVLSAHGGVVALIGGEQGFVDTIHSYVGGDDTLLHDVLAVADFDGDGALDVLVQPKNDAGYPFGELRVHRGDGRGSFAQWQTLDLFGCQEVADFDGDGRADIFTGLHRNKVTVTGWDGGRWRTHFAATGEDARFLRFVYSIAVGDFDGNGTQDVAWVTSIPDDYERATLEVAYVDPPGGEAGAR